MRHEKKWRGCDAQCSSVQSLLCFSSAGMSKGRKTTMYSVSNLQVGLKNQGTKSILLTVIKGDVNFCLHFFSLLLDRDKA